MSLNATFVTMLLAATAAQDVKDALIAKDLPVLDDDARNVNLLFHGVDNQRRLAAIVIVDLKVHDAKVVTDLLAAAFPKDKVGSRHGPYYVSLARTGHLTGTPTAIAFARKAKAVKAEATTEQDNDDAPPTTLAPQDDPAIARALDSQPLTRKGKRAKDAMNATGR